MDASRKLTMTQFYVGVLAEMKRSWWFLVGVMTGFTSSMLMGGRMTVLEGAIFTFCIVLLVKMINRVNGEME